MAVFLDHVIHVVKDRDEAADRLRRLGFNAKPGGRHSGFGSVNNLCYFDLFYIEILAIEDRDEALNAASSVCREAVAFLEKGEGFGNIAFETLELDAVVKSLRAAGMEVGDVVRLQRVQPDGFVARSRIAYPAVADTPIPLPIVIERDVPPDVRRADLVKRGVIAQHAAGDLTVDSIALSTADLGRTEKLFQRGYGLQTRVSYHDEYTNAQCVRLGTDRGDIVLCEPRGPGIARDHLDYRNGGPFLLIMRSKDPEAVRRRIGADENGTVRQSQANGMMMRII